MVRFENAKEMSPEEIRDILDEETKNPTMERLFFIEAKSIGGESKIWPCFISAYGLEDVDPPAVPKIKGFEMYICQSARGEFGMLKVYVTTEELGVSKRIWDKPPKSAVIAENPIVKVEEGIQ